MHINKLYIQLKNQNINKTEAPHGLLCNCPSLPVSSKFIFIFTIICFNLDSMCQY